MKPNLCIQLMYSSAVGFLLVFLFGLIDIKELFIIVALIVGGSCPVKIGLKDGRYLDK